MVATPPDFVKQFIDVKNAIERLWRWTSALGLTRVQYGTVTITPSAANTPTSQTVTFPIPYPAAPNAQVTPNTTVVGTTVTGWAVSGSTATSILVWLTRTNTSATALYWLAYL